MIKAKIMDGDNIGMGKVGRRARFLAKPLLEGLIIGIILMQNFDRHRTFQHQIPRPEHIRHAT